MLSNSGYDSTIAYWNLNKSLLFGDTLFSTNCCQKGAIAALQHCCVVEFELTTIFCYLQLTTPGVTSKQICTFSFALIHIPDMWLFILP